MDLSADVDKSTPVCRCRVLYLGSSFPQSKDGLQSIQDPLRELYPDIGAIGARGIDSWLSIWSNGILLENVDENHKKVTKFFPIETLHYCAAVRFVYVPDRGAFSEPKFLPLDTQLARIPNPNHPPLFTAILRRTEGIKVLECHAFICKREVAANALVRSCFHVYSDSRYVKHLDKVQGTDLYNTLTGKRKVRDRFRWSSVQGGARLDEVECLPGSSLTLSGSTYSSNRRTSSGVFSFTSEDDEISIFGEDSQKVWAASNGTLQRNPPTGHNFTENPYYVKEESRNSTLKALKKFKIKKSKTEATKKKKIEEEERNSTLRRVSPEYPIIPAFPTTPPGAFMYGLPVPPQAPCLPGPVVVSSTLPRKSKISYTTVVSPFVPGPGLLVSDRPPSRPTPLLIQQYATINVKPKKSYKNKDKIKYIPAPVIVNYHGTWTPGMNRMRPQPNFHPNRMQDPDQETLRSHSVNSNTIKEESEDEGGIYGRRGHLNERAFSHSIRNEERSRSYGSLANLKFGSMTSTPKSVSSVDTVDIKKEREIMQMMQDLDLSGDEADKIEVPSFPQHSIPRVKW